MHGYIKRRRKSLDNQHSFKIKTLSKQEVEENFLNMIKNIYKNLTADITLNGENLRAFSPWLG